MLELYYTSAPEGLKPGSRGFCTVAASEALQKQKQLWDRLEALSGYRHHFQHNAQASAAARNPVSFAHWLLNLMGKEYHILSRICDSGTDYTQRTNAFAHHLVLDNTELPEIGPASLLSADGLMSAAWDQTAGALPPRSLDPFLNHRPATLVANTWAQLTGDAGHAALLAGAAEKYPRTPVCVLFTPEQSDLLLPLLAESLALLSPQLRWQITFNTYFTSMPTSASCAWRCCLIKTPAADAALRYASGNASGLVLNLTDLSKLPAAPASALATLARTGAPPAPKTPAKPTQAIVAEQTAAVPDGQEVAPEALPASVVVDVSEEDFVSVAPVYPGSSATSRAGKPPVKTPPVSTRAPGYITVPPPVPHREPMRVAPASRLWILMLFVLFFILALVGLVYFILNWLNPEPVSTLPIAPPPRVVTTLPVAPPPTVSTTLTHPVVETTTTKPVVVATAPAVTTIPAVVLPPRIPKTVVIKTALAFHPTGSSMRDKTDTLTLDPADFDNVPLRSVSALSMLFPNDKPTYTITQTDLSGTFTMAPEAPSAGHHGFALHWKDALDATASGQVLSVYLDKTHAQVLISWRTGIILRHPEVATLAFWILQRSTLIAADNALAQPKLQRIVFRPVECKPLSLADATTVLDLPSDLPALTTPVAGAALKLPLGWSAEGYIDWPDKDPATHTAANAAYVLRFKKATSVGPIDAWFLLSFKGVFTHLESTFAQALAAAQSDVLHFQADIDALDLDIKQVTEVANAEIAAQTNPVEIQVRKNNLANTLAAKQAKRTQSEQLLKGSTEAVAAYRELQKFPLDIPLVLPDATPLVTLHFAPAK